MIRYIAIDSGKFATKIAEYSVNKDESRKMCYRTKVSPGDFRDDALEKNTYLFQWDDTVYKIGNGAKGDGADLETTKNSEIHRLCTLNAIALLCSETEVDEVHVAIGLPAKDWAVVDKREEYKRYILPEGEITVTIKTDSEADPVNKTFVIKKKYVFPESIGALFMDDSPAITASSYVGVLDIGNLNLNATIWQGTELQQDESVTDELGGSILIQELSQELSSEFSRCDPRFVAQIINQKPENRYLRPKNGDPDVMERSKEIINKHMYEHAKRIKRCCDGRRWSLDYMDLIAIGGTASRLEEELKEVFGENICIPANSIYCNVLGYLRMMCAKTSELGKIVPLP